MAEFSVARAFMQMFTPDPLFSGNAIAAPAAVPAAANAQSLAGNGFDALMAQHMADRAAPDAPRSTPAPDKVANDDADSAPTVPADKAPQEAATAATAEKETAPKAVDAKTPESKETRAETAAPKAAAPQVAANDETLTTAEKPGKAPKTTEDEQGTPVADTTVVVQVDVQPQVQPTPPPEVTVDAQVVAAVAQAVAGIVVPVTADGKQAQETQGARTNVPAPEIKGRAAPVLPKPATQTSDARLATATEAGDTVPAVEDAFVNLLGKAVKGAAKSAGDDTQNDPASGDDGQSTPSQTQVSAAEPKAAAAKVANALEALQTVTQPSQTADTAPVPAVQPQTAAPSDSTTPTAFSLQSLQDTSGSYSATGSSTTAASNMSKAAVETLSALSMQISKRLSEGSTKFAIELHPADLGKVEVTLNIARDGKTTAHLRFDTPITAATFSSQEGELRQQLAQTGLTFDKDSLSFSSRDGGAGFGASLADQQGSQSQGQARQAARALEAAGKAAEETDANAALDVALANFRNRSSQSLALNLIV